MEKNLNSLNERLKIIENIYAIKNHRDDNWPWKCGKHTF